MRFLYHALPTRELRWGQDGRYRPESLAREGFIHTSYRDLVLESARLYLPPGEPISILAVDPRRLDVPVEIVETPRGPMPHVRGAIPVDAVRVLTAEAALAAPDVVRGSAIGLCAFAGMELLDLVGPLDVLARLGGMGFDPTATCEVIAISRPASGSGAEDVVVWEGSSASLRAARYRPALDGFDVLVIPGGDGARALAEDAALISYLGSYPENRLLASVRNGALLVGALGRLRGEPATTRRSALGARAAFGATATESRVVDAGNIITSGPAGGIGAGIDVGIRLVRRLYDDATAAAIAAEIELPFVRPSVAASG